MQVFNTLSREKETFTPITPKQINMYVCGPTVYNYIHIGNARSAIAFDTIRRYFEYRGYNVNFVSNFTDVDDKMIAQAKTDGITVPELADRYIDAFNKDTAPLNIRPATTRTRATDVIPEIIDFVQDLIAKDYAYEVNGDVYFRARKSKDYAHLAHQNLDELEAGASGRIDDAELALKEDPLDFAVWKGAHNDGAIAWQSPWGDGRPGWHIECSVMSTKYLGNTIDIHGGGIDLAFPHHTNEIAQSEAHTGQTFVNYWLHNGFVNVNDEKMSKSLGNFTTVHDLLEHYDDPLVIRYLMATVQYRRPINYSPDELERARVELDRIRTGYRNLAFRQKDAVAGADDSITAAINQQVDHFVAAMDDDFNAQNALSSIFELVTLANNLANSDTLYQENVTFLLNTLTELMSIFGIESLEDTIISDTAIEAKIKARDLARDKGDFTLSDQIRDELKTQGIILEDTANGTRWHKA